MVQAPMSTASLQRMAQCTRRGSPDKLQTDRFTEALHDEDAGMTFPALTGQRKQSVQDAEILFSEGVAHRPIQQIPPNGIATSNYQSDTFSHFNDSPAGGSISQPEKKMV